MRISLINPFIKYKSNNKKIHLGLHYLASSLLEDGHEVLQLDAQLFEIENSIVIDHLRRFNVEVVGLSLLPASYIFAKSLIDEIVKYINPNPIIVIGNHLANIFKEEIFKFLPKSNYLILGEGTDTFSDLANSIENNVSFKNVPNIITKIDDKIIKTEIRRTNINLDELKIIDPDNLNDILNKTIPQRTITYLSSLGCSGTCNFCVTEVNGIRQKYSDYKSARRIYNDIVYYKRKYNIEGIDFVDDDFLNPPEKRAFELASMIIKNDLGINFWFSTRADRIHESLIVILKNAGLSSIFIGVESFLQNRLDRFKKRMSLDKILGTLAICKKLQINTRIGFILFDPFSTLDEISNDISYIIDIGMQHSIAILFQQLKIYPNTPAASFFKKHKIALSLDKNEMKLKYSYPDKRVQKLINYIEFWNDFFLPTILNFLELSCHTRTNTNKKIGEAAYRCFKNLRSLEIDFILLLLKNIDDVDSDSFDDIINFFKGKFISEINNWNKENYYLYPISLEHSFFKQFSI